ncbi:MAG: NUDIX domain-containing protein [Gemmataceae bacterium]
MWEFPHGPLAEGESAEAGAVRLARELTGLEIRLGGEIVTLRHGVTRFAITVVCFEADCVAGVFRSDAYAAAAWVEPARLADYPVSAPQRRLIRLLTEPGRQRTLF